jgi:hypothetical protein
MLDLSTAVLCDFAQVRDRLLFVSSGAVSRLYRQELPSPLGLMVGLVIEVPLEDAGMDHQLRAEVINRHGTVLATLENTFRVSDVGLFPHEVQQVPLVLSITGVRARTWGTHQVRLYLDGDLVRALTLYVVPAAGPQSAVRATPTQSRVADDEGSLPGGGDEAPSPSDEAVADAPDRVLADDAEDSGHQVVLATDELTDLDAPVVLDEGFAPSPEPAFDTSPPEGQPLRAAPPAPDEAVDWGDPADDDPAPVPAPAPAPAPAVFDFEDDDPGAEQPDPAQGDREASRFSFRYLVDED